ncbi:hypothetical protein AAFF_G00180150 [Aldrovandia affinis]|uniref:Uncharacterized protein n=1 Tax=Aldrovandia affinis TaxID=143900 RepID=A0AAD7SYF6_9TELE|nr:hypothetical protein AAFF_G00180150 [Aldrovandia affinis]
MKCASENWFQGKKVLWLALILFVVLLVLGTIVQKVYRRNQCRTAVLLPVSAYRPPEAQGRYPTGAVNAEITSSEIVEGLYFNPYRCSYKRSTLSPIQEEEATEPVSVSLPGI